MNLLAAIRVAPSGLVRTGWLLALVFLVLSLVVDKVASVVFAIFFLAGCYLLVRRRQPALDARTRFLLAAFAFYFAVGVLAFFLGEQTRLGEKLMGRDIRFLGALPVAFVILHLRIPGSLLGRAIAVGGVVTGLFALLEWVLSGGERAEGEGISILFGHLAAALAVANVAFAMQGEGRFRSFALLAATMAALAVLLSGTRGAFVSVLLVTFVLLLGWCGLNARRWLMAGLVVALVAGGLFLSPLGGRFLQRMNDGLGQVSAHQQVVAQGELVGAMGAPACLDAVEWLEWLATSDQLRRTGGLHVAVKRGPAFSVAGQCEGRAFLRITNAGSEEGRIVFPERSLAPGALAAGTLLLRGGGKIDVTRDGARAKTFDFRGPGRVSLEGPPGPRPRFVLDVPPGGTVDLVFIANAPGEYAFPDAAHSIPARRYMWEAAIDGFLERPLLGYGTGSFPALLKDRAEVGESPWQITGFDHAHNELLTVAVERGLVGLVSLLLLYAVPLWLFWYRRDPAGVAGLAFVSAVIISGFSETIFNHSLAITYYCTLVLLLAAVPRTACNNSSTN